MSKRLQRIACLTVTALFVFLWWLAIQLILWFADEHGTTQVVAYLKAAEPYILLGLSGCYWILFTFILNRLEKKQ